MYDAENDESKYEWMEAIGNARLEAVQAFRAKKYLELLGLDPSATSVQIKKKYRKMARATHPDKGGDQDKFLALTEAYEVTSVPRCRKMHQNVQGWEIDCCRSQRHIT